MRLDGKVVLVTGTGHGFGRDIARAFGLTGATVCIGWMCLSTRPTTGHGSFLRRPRRRSGSGKSKSGWLFCSTARGPSEMGYHEGPGGAGTLWAWAAAPYRIAVNRLGPGKSTKPASVTWFARRAKYAAYED